MTALGLVNTLRAKTRTVDSAFLKDDDFAWGTYKELRGVDTKTLTRQELKNHLEARDLATTGNKGKLARRLQASVLDEQSKSYADAEDAEFQLGADLEERGAVYVVGTNSSGQLGLGDLTQRERFEVVPETRGAGVCFVSAGYDTSFAVTEDHDVLSWGGKGTGATGHRLGTGAFDDDDDDLYKEPRPIRDLMGEEVCQVRASSSHCLGVSKGGDLYVWGRGDSGQLGLGDRESKQVPVLNTAFPEGTEIHYVYHIPELTPTVLFRQVEVGENHSLALTKAGELYSWGHGDRGRLGVGASWRVGVPESEKNVFPTPMLLHTFSKEIYDAYPHEQVSCGPSFCLAVTAANVWSWGTGEAFVLGHGDTVKRDTPAQIEALKGSAVLQAECGTWHCAALVLVPPCKDGGYLYTWGSGYHGQLALGTRQVQPTPAIVSKLLVTQQLLTRVWCGSHHCAGLTTDGELYTWGSNRTGGLGRALPDDEPFSADPGHVGGFGVLVDGVGRGLPRAVTCGKEFTLVATYPYEGPVMEVAVQVMQASAIEEEEIRLVEEEQLRQRKQAGKDRKRELARAAEMGLALPGKVSTKLCSICEECPGFRPTPVRETICLGCHHSLSFHTRVNSSEVAGYSAADTLSKY
ncbi:unnamed protein product [Pylaiella littoralis]